jgi:hypothetical protein
MIKRNMVGLAMAASLVAGLGAYGATSAFAATTDPTAKPAPSSGSPAADRDAMIQHCTQHLPAGDRAKAREQMRRMMSGGHSMMGDTGSHPMG